MREFLGFLVEKKENFERKEEKFGKGDNYSFCVRLQISNDKTALYKE